MLLLGVFLLGAPLLRAQSETPVKKVAILEVVDKANEMPYGMKLLLRTSLAKAITQTQGYEGYDRVDMEAIQGEQDFQRTGMVSDEQIKRLGEMTGAAYILVAEAAKLDASTILVTAKILDVETAKLERTDYEQMGMSAKEMSDGCRKMAGRLFVAQSPEVSPYNADKTRKDENESDDSNVIQLDQFSNVIRKGTRLLVENQYMAQERMSEGQLRNYLGNYYGSWKQQKKRWNGSVALMASGGLSFAIGLPLLASGIVLYVDQDYYHAGSWITGCFFSALGIALEAAGGSICVKANKEMDRILKTVNGQHGIGRVPYQTEVIFNVGNQPHGFGLGMRF